MSDQFPQMEWNENQRALLNELLEEIIPASNDGRIPSARSDHVADFIIKKTREIPGLGELISQGMQTIQNAIETLALPFDRLARKERLTLMKELEQQKPDFFAALVRYTYMAYYTDPQIPPLYGLSKKPPHPYGYNVPEETLADITALVEPVKKRGIYYQQC